MAAHITQELKQELQDLKETIRRQGSLKDLQRMHDSNLPTSLPDADTSSSCTLAYPRTSDTASHSHVASPPRGMPGLLAEGVAVRPTGADCAVRRGGAALFGVWFPRDLVSTALTPTERCGTRRVCACACAFVLVPVTVPVAHLVYIPCPPAQHGAWGEKVCGGGGGGGGGVRAHCPASPPSPHCDGGPKRGLQGVQMTSPTTH